MKSIVVVVAIVIAVRRLRHIFRRGLICICFSCCCRRRGFCCGCNGGYYDFGNGRRTTIIIINIIFGVVVAIQSIRSFEYDPLQFVRNGGNTVWCCRRNLIWYCTLIFVAVYDIWFRRRRRRHFIIGIGIRWLSVDDADDAFSLVVCVRYRFRTNFNCSILIRFPNMLITSKLEYHTE